MDEEELASLKSLVEIQSAADDVIGMEEDFRALLCKVAELEAAEAPSPLDELAWAESLEGAVTEAAEAMADEAEYVRRGVAVLALRPGEAATVAALRRHAALADARRAEAEEVAAAARRLQEKNLRSFAARENLDDLSWLLGRVAGRAMGPSLREGAPEDLAELERSCAEMEEGVAWLAGSLRRGASAFAARPGGEEEALVGALRRQAASADGRSRRSRPRCAGYGTEKCRARQAGRDDCLEIDLYRL